jgi:lipoprotein NlpI
MLKFGSMRIAGALLAVSSSLPLAAQQLSPDWARCVNKGGAFSTEEIIAGCTSVLQLGRETTVNRSIAYYNRGNAYRAKGKGDQDRAIADYDEAIRLNPSLAMAYSNRGLSYYDKREYDRAIADHSEVIRLNPNLWLPYTNRGNAYLAKGDQDRAIADYSEAIRLSPRNAEYYRNRGRAYLYRGSLPSAQADFKQASDLDAKDAYGALWLDLAERRGNRPSRLKQLSSQLDMARWPAPVVRLLLGELSPEQTLAAADHAEPRTRSKQVCEASFYSGQLALLEAHKDEALRLLRRTAADCPRSLIEWTSARAELRLLGEP